MNSCLDPSYIMDENETAHQHEKYPDVCIHKFGKCRKHFYHLFEDNKRKWFYDMTTYKKILKIKNKSEINPDKPIYE